MRYVYLKHSKRSKAEQWYIQATLEIWKSLPEERRTEIRELIRSIAGEGAEARALFDVTVRGVTPEAACAPDGMQLRRLYALRESFYDQFPI